jgi:hypothetical protein
VSNPVAHRLSLPSEALFLLWNVGFLREKLCSTVIRPAKKATIRSMQEHPMRKVLRGYAKDKDGNLILIGTMPVPHSKDKPSPRERKDKRHLVRQGATSFKKETVG